MKSMPGRVRLEFAEQARVAALAYQVMLELCASVALCPEIAVWTSRTSGPLYERVEAAWKMRALAPSPLLQQRIEILWDRVNDLHSLLLLSLRDLCQSKAATYASILEQQGHGGHDLLAVAEIGALRGIRRYQPAHGTQLGMYAKNWILKALRAEVDALLKTPAGRAAERVSLTIREGDGVDGDGQRELTDPNPPDVASLVARAEEEEEEDKRKRLLGAALEALKATDAPAATAVARHFKLRGAKGVVLPEDLERGMSALWGLLRAGG